MTFWQKMSDVIKQNLWAVGLIVGVLFLGIGIYEEQLTDMYRKAVMICLECIGIG